MSSTLRRISDYRQWPRDALPHLARQLQRRGAKVSFKSSPAWCPDQSAGTEFEVHALPEQPLVACEELAGRDLYSSWLGCTQEQDAAQCLDVLASAGINGASWIVADHYGLDSRWEAQMVDGLASSCTTEVAGDR